MIAILLKSLLILNNIVVARHGGFHSILIAMNNKVRQNKHCIALNHFFRVGKLFTIIR
jgi:hypothetical protein